MAGKTPSFDQHIQMYKKNGMALSDLRTKRKEKGMELRREKRFQHVQLWRPGLGEETSSPSASANKATPLSAKTINLREMILALKSTNNAEVIATIAKLQGSLFFKELSVDECIRAGIVSPLVNCLKRDDCSVQCDAARFLANITAGTSFQTEAVVAGGAVPVLGHLLSSPSADVLEQVLVAIENIAVDCDDFANHLIEHGILTPLLTLLGTSSQLPVIRGGAACLSLLTEDLLLTPDIVGLIYRMMQLEDPEVLKKTCWAFYGILLNGDWKEKVIQQPVYQRVVQLLMHESRSVAYPALLAVGQIVSGGDAQVQTILESGLLPALLHLVRSSECMHIETCFVISFITKGNASQLQAVIEAGIFPALNHVMQYSEVNCKEEALWAVKNATSKGNPEQVRAIVQAGCIESLCNLLDIQDNEIIYNALGTISDILRAGKQAHSGTSIYADEVEEKNGRDKMERLITYSNRRIGKKAAKIIDQYFDVSCDGNGEL